jgi:hypothetical protein
MNRASGLIVLLAALLPSSAFAEARSDPQPPAQAPEPPPKKPFYLITDYLPPAIYDGDEITACFRVENTTGADADLELLVLIKDSDGRELSRKSLPVKATARQFATCQTALDSRAGASLSFTLNKSGNEVASAKAMLIRDETPWPQTRVRLGRLETDPSGEAIIPVVRKRIKNEERAYSPLRWLLNEDAAESQQKSAGALAFVPGRWRMSEGKSASYVALGPYAADGCPPILRAVDQILKRVAKGDAQRLVILLPPEDLDVASDPRIYRTVLDALLAHLKTLKVEKVTLVPPLHYGSGENHRQMLWKSVHEQASAYEVESVDATEQLDEMLWRADPEVKGGYGVRPNSGGLKKIEQALANLLP